MAKAKCPHEKGKDFNEAEKVTEVSNCCFRGSDLPNFLNFKEINLKFKHFPGLIPHFWGENQGYKQYFFLLTPLPLLKKWDLGRRLYLQAFSRLAKEGEKGEGEDSKKSESGGKGEGFSPMPDG